MAPIVRTRLELLTQKVYELRPKKAQNNEFVESGLEKLGFSDSNNAKVDWNDKIIKTYGFMLKKNVLGNIRGAQLLYIALRFDYKTGSWLLQYFPFDFSIPFHGGSLTLYSSLWTILILHLLIIWALTWIFVLSDTPFGFLWVTVAKAALFKGLFLINATRKVAVVHLMRW